MSHVLSIRLVDLACQGVVETLDEAAVFPCVGDEDVGHDQAPIWTDPSSSSATGRNSRKVRRDSAFTSRIGTSPLRRQASMRSRNDEAQRRDTPSLDEARGTDGARRCAPAAFAQVRRGTPRDTHETHAHEAHGQHPFRGAPCRLSSPPIGISSRFSPPLPKSAAAGRPARLVISRTTTRLVVRRLAD